MASRGDLQGVRARLRAPETFTPDPGRDWLRMLGGLVFAVGAVILYVRKSGGVAGGDEWAAFPLLLLVLVPCVALYALAVAGRVAGEALQPWQSVLLVAAVLLVPLVLLQLVDVLGGSPGDSLNLSWVFLATAAAAAYAAFRLGASYQVLLAALAVLIAWLAFWDKVLDDPSLNTVRWLVVIAGLGFLAGAVALLRESPRPGAEDVAARHGAEGATAANRSQPATAAHGSELVTAAGITAVIVGLLSVVGVIAGAVSSLLAGGVEGAKPNLFWDLVLLVPSLALVAYGARVGARGPSYVGAFGLLVFILVIGLDVGSLADGERPEGKVIGWPLLLLLLGLAGLVASLALAGRRAAGSSAAPPPPPGAAPPSA